MSASTGLFQFSPFQSDQLVPAHAVVTTDPLGQIVAVISAYLPEGVGSSLYDWQQTAYLRADFAREKVELVWLMEGEYSVEGEWTLDTGDDDVTEYLLLRGGEEPDDDTFGVLASCAPELQIAPPSPEVRRSWSEDTSFREGVPAEDWVASDD